MPPVNYALSRMRWWDLIIYAEHRGVDQYHPSIPKLMIQHGYDSGKLFDGEDIRYGPRSMYRGDNGKPRYRRILESSETTCQKAIAADPKLDGRIAVVGDVGADRMLDLVRRRREIRQELGYSDADIVVLLMGTWRQDSLMESAGRELVAEAIRLRGQYQFVFSTHPLHWKGEYAAKHPWGKFLLENRQPGIAVVEPDDDGEKAAIAADILIADHTSLAVKYALLKKPLLLWERREGLVAPGTFGDRIYQALPHVHGVKDLGNALETARQWYPMERLSAFADEINSYPGQAAARIRQEVLQLLNL